MCVSQGSAVGALLCHWLGGNARSGCGSSGHNWPGPRGRVGESRETTVKRILPVQRSDDAEFLGFGKAREASNARVSPQVGRFLPQRTHDEMMRRKAERYLAERRLVKVKRSRKEFGMTV